MASEVERISKELRVLEKDPSTPCGAGQGMDALLIPESKNFKTDGKNGDNENASLKASNDMTNKTSLQSEASSKDKDLPKEDIKVEEESCFFNYLAPNSDSEVETECALREIERVKRARRKKFKADRKNGTKGHASPKAVKDSDVDYGTLLNEVYDFHERMIEEDLGSSDSASSSHQDWDYEEAGYFVIEDPYPSSKRRRSTR